MKRNFSPSIFLLHWKDQLKSQYNFFDRMFGNCLNISRYLILFELKITQPVTSIVHNHFSKQAELIYKVLKI